MKLYLTLTIMAAGFAMTVGGPRSVTAVAFALLVRPVQLATSYLRLAAILVLATASQLLMRYIVRPTLAELRFWFNWLIGSRP